MLAASRYLFILLLVAGCGKNIPKFPEQIHNFYVTVVRHGNMPDEFLNKISNVDEFTEVFRGLDTRINCLEFEVVQQHPFLIEYRSEVDMSFCHLVGGLKPEDQQALFSWIDDVIAWAKEKNAFNK